MHRRRRSTKNVQTTRFSLLLLEDGELFLDDYSACRYLEPWADTHRKVSGRLKVCTRGLFFVPHDLLLPILRFPFRSMPVEPMAECFTVTSDACESRNGGMTSAGSGDPPVTYLTFQSKLLVEMRERGIDHPYVYKETSDSADKAQHGTCSRMDGDAPSKFIFTLLHSPLETFLGSLHVIFEVANLPHRMLNKVDEERLLAPVLAPRLAEVFDPSLLVDFREKPLLDAGQAVDRIEPLLKYPGCLMLTDLRLYFQPAALNNVLDPVLNWEYTHVEQLYKRRYLLQQTGLEVSLRGGESFFFSLPSHAERDAIYALLVAQPELRRCQRTDLRHMMRKWQRREISNFDYLLFLNNASGRTRNDLTQYPVFPWILTDYTSAELDLSDPKIFRDLSRPIGALNAERLEYFKTRYEVMPRGDEAEGMPPPFLYGTHYSTPGYVLYYLVRMAPQYMLCLQSGKFDSPDRLFRSVKATWDGCISNHTDVKELIPEFFDCSFPAEEWLRNTKHLDLGATQTFDRVDDVQLPPWAHDDPAEFVRKNREALESGSVSERLHHWIDLIFGYKQQGEEAVKADNLFYYLSYEGSVDLETIDDPVQKCSLESQIQEFGQTPKLLFSTPHPSRSANDWKIQVATPDLLPSPRVSVPAVRRVSYPLDNISKLRLRRRKVTELSHFGDDGSYGESDDDNGGDSGAREQKRQGYSLLCLQAPWRRVPGAFVGLSSQFWGSSSSSRPVQDWKWRSKLRKKYSLSPSWSWKQTSSFQPHAGEVTSAVLSKDEATLFTTCKDSSLKLSSTGDGSQLRELSGQFPLSCCDVSPDEQTVFVGSWDNRVYMYLTTSGAEVDKLFAHSDGISAIRVLRDRFFTSSWDSTIKLWRYTSSFIVDLPIRTFLECEDSVLCLDVSRDGHYGAAGTRNGHVYLFDLDAAAFHSKVYVSPTRGGDISSISFASDGKSFVCVSLTNELLQYNLQGEQLWSREISTTGQVRCFESDGQYAVGGTTTGELLFWKLHEELGEELVYSIPQAHDTIISALAVSCSGATLVSADSDGFVHVWKLLQGPPMLQKRVSLPRLSEVPTESSSIQAVSREKKPHRSKTKKRRKKKKRRENWPLRQQPAFYVPGLTSQIAEAQCYIEF